MFSNTGNILFMEIDTQMIFVAGVKRLYSDINIARKQLGKKKIPWYKIAEAIGVTGGNLSGFLTFSRNYTEEKRKELATYFKKTYLQVFDIGREELERTGQLSARLPAMQMTGTATSEPPQNDIQKKQNDIQKKKNARHHEIIDDFQNKILATEINKILVEIERREPEKLIIARDMLNGLLAGTPDTAIKIKKTGTI